MPNNFEDLFARDSVIDELARFSRYLTANPNATVSMVKARLEQLPEIRSRFLATQLPIELHAANDEEKAGQKEIRISFEDNYSDTLAAYHEWLDAKQPAPAPVIVKSDSDTPTNNDPVVVDEKAKFFADVPRFRGNRSEWIEFREKFGVAVKEAFETEEEDLDGEQRLKWLKRCVYGPPSKLMSFVSSYDKAWELLDRNYDNERLLIDAHLKLISEATPLSKGTRRGLTNFVDLCRKNINVLANLAERKDSDIASAALLHLMVSKLDGETCKAWESHMLQRRDVPTAEEFFTFLNERLVTLPDNDPPDFDRQTENGNILGKRKGAPPVASNKAPPNVGMGGKKAWKEDGVKPPCKVCKGIFHPTHVCPTFLAMSANARNNCIKKKNLCRICFLPECKAMCQKFKCDVCQGTHNTLLHRFPSEMKGPQEQLGSACNPKSVLAKLSIRNGYSSFVKSSASTDDYNGFPSLGGWQKDATIWQQNASNWQQDTNIWQQGAGNRQQDANNWQQDANNWQQDANNWQQDANNAPYGNSKKGLKKVSNSWMDNPRFGNF